MEKTGIGIIGCGNISSAYLKHCTEFLSSLEVAACADIIPERAKARASEFGVPKACSPQELLADDSIEIVLNLTTPPVHAEVNRQVLESGKHVYVEKPLAVDRNDARDTLELAAKKSLRVGCAPDTFLGGGIQTCRKIIDDGDIGDPVAAVAFMVGHGHESWHPDPEFYYQVGGGPMLDMGPYYLTALVNLMGPIKRISGSTRISFPTRTITSQPKHGNVIQVETPTHLTGAIEFAGGAIATIVMSFDVWKMNLPRIEIYGSKGSLSVPDPNTFGGPIQVFHEGDEDWSDVVIEDYTYTENSRGLGVADMARGIGEGSAHRASGELAFHVLDAMLSFEEASTNGSYRVLESTCEQPKPLPTGLKLGQV